MAKSAVPIAIQDDGAGALVVVEQLRDDEKTYGQILKSTALVGGSSVANIAMGIIRTKAIAMLLGPAGFGLAALYMSIANLTQSIAGMGLNNSGVRQIAEASGSDDKERMVRTAAMLRRTSVLFGALGAAVLIVFSRQVSTLTFGSNHHAASVSLLSLVVFFNLVSAGQGALIQGLRRIADLAQMGVLGALYGTIITILIVYLFGQRGVVPSLVAVAALSLITSWWYSRKIRIPRRSVTLSEGAQEISALLKLGFAFMASGLMTMGSAYLVRIIVLRELGLEATGLYQSAWTLGGLYVGIILQAMGSDFYPRLTASASDNRKCNRLVNEQTQVGLLLAGPGVLATLTFAPLVFALFYSTEFGVAVELLRWVCLGVTLQVISWPMGFVILAQGKHSIFLFSDLAWTIVHVGLAWICVSVFGLNGAGIAFFGSYIFHLLVTYPLVHRLSGFRWSVQNRKAGLVFLSLITLVFSGCYVLTVREAACLGAVALLASSSYSMRVLLKFIPLSQIPHSVQSILVRVRLLQSTAAK